MERYAVIMGGGSGKRLWPLSRLDKPKQFVNLLGEGPLLTMTIKRLLNSFESDHILVIGIEEHKEALYECAAGLIPKENVLLEPLGRNTAACIALATAHLGSKEDVVMSVFPADHYVGDVKAFGEVVARGMDAAENSNSIVTVGIEPTFDATGYGYIHVGGKVEGVAQARRVKSFTEKPDKERAKLFFDSGEYLWNGGIFLSRTSVMRENFLRLLPELFDGVQKAHDAMERGDKDAAYDAYSKVANIPVDTGIMEKCDNIIVFPGNFYWSDVGSFYAVHDILKNHAGNAVIEGVLLAPQANNLTVYSKKKIVAASGVDDLVIIDMDDVLYICNVKDSEKTKQLVETLSEYGHDELE